MKTRGQKRTWKGEEGGRVSKWREHDLEMADERAAKGGRNRLTNNKWWGDTNKWRERIKNQNPF